MNSSKLSRNPGGRNPGGAQPASCAAAATVERNDLVRQKDVAGAARIVKSLLFAYKNSIGRVEKIPTLVSSLWFCRRKLFVYPIVNPQLVPIYQIERRLFF